MRHFINAVDGSYSLFQLSFLLIQKKFDEITIHSRFLVHQVFENKVKKSSKLKFFATYGYKIKLLLN